MGNPVVHFEIVHKDAAKLQPFYRELFDWKIDANNEMNYGVIDTGGKGINGGISPTMDPTQPSHLMFYISVPDINAKLEEIEKAGGKIVLPRSVIPGMVTLAQFSDPSGNVIGLVEDEIPPA